MLQQREQDIQVEDYITCYGETAIKPLFRILSWFLGEDADHPSVQQRYIRVTGKPSMDHQAGRDREWRMREDFTINVGLGVDSPEYKNTKATMLIQVFMTFNQMMSGQVLPNLLPKMYEGFRDQVSSLGYDPDIYLMTRDEFQQFYQTLIQKSQEQAQNGESEAMKQLQIQSLQAENAEKMAKARKAEAEAMKA
jgi:hypothetical protein